MRGDEGRIADSGDVPEPALVEVRQIDQNPQPVASADQLLAEVRKTGSRVGRRGTAERHAMPERIRPAPNGAERAKSRLIQYVQELEIRVDCFRAFDMKNRCQYAVLQASLDIIDIAADANAALQLPLDTEEKGHHAEDSPLRRRQFKGRRRQGTATGVSSRRFASGANCPIGRRDEDREQPPGEPSFTRHGKIQLALGLSFEERPGGVRAAAPVKTQQDVIVAIEDRHAPRRCHQKCSVAGIFNLRPLPDRKLGVIARPRMAKSFGLRASPAGSAGTRPARRAGSRSTTAR